MLPPIMLRPALLSGFRGLDLYPGKTQIALPVELAQSNHSAVSTSMHFWHRKTQPANNLPPDRLHLMQRGDSTSSDSNIEPHHFLLTPP